MSERIQKVGQPCPWFPNTTCDEICSVSCGMSGLLIHMKASGVPVAELGAIPEQPEDESQ
jgi:hypothetical protein